VDNSEPTANDAVHFLNLKERNCLSDEKKDLVRSALSVLFFDRPIKIFGRPIKEVSLTRSAVRKLLEEKLTFDKLAEQIKEDTIYAIYNALHQLKGVNLLPDRFSDVNKILGMIMAGTEQIALEDYPDDEGKFYEKAIKIIHKKNESELRTLLPKTLKSLLSKMADDDWGKGFSYGYLRLKMQATREEDNPNLRNIFQMGENSEVIIAEIIKSINFPKDERYKFFVSNDRIWVFPVENLGEMKDFLDRKMEGREEARFDEFEFSPKSKEDLLFIALRAGFISGFFLETRGNNFFVKKGTKPEPISGNVINIAQRF